MIFLTRSHKSLSMITIQLKLAWEGNMDIKFIGEKSKFLKLVLNKIHDKVGEMQYRFCNNRFQ